MSEKKDPYEIWDRYRGKFTEAQLHNTLRSSKYSNSAVARERYAKVKERRPDWFRDSESAAKKKAELLARAARGEGRPAANGKNKHPLGVLLCEYTNPNKKSYDPVFDQAIRAAAPGWFLDTAAIKKEELLAMAARKEGRPACCGKNKHPLGTVFFQYTSRKSAMYDPVFDQQIRAAAPHWFLNKVATNKQELLAMAARGEGRPAATGKNKHPLGAVLCDYTNPNNKSRGYDPVFDQAIRAAAPHWFEYSNKLRATRQKKELVDV